MHISIYIYIYNTPYILYRRIIRLLILLPNSLKFSNRKKTWENSSFHITSREVFIAYCVCTCANAMLSSCRLLHCCFVRTCLCVRSHTRERECNIGSFVLQHDVHGTFFFFFFLFFGRNFTYKNNRLVSVSSLTNKLFGTTVEFEFTIICLFFYAVHLSFVLSIFPINCVCFAPSLFMLLYAHLSLCLKLNWIAMKTKNTSESQSTS